MDNFGQIKQALLEVDVDDEDATVLARKLIDEGFKDLTKIKRKCSIRPPQHCD